jgi:hypothetical protein
MGFQDIAQVTPLAASAPVVATPGYLISATLTPGTTASTLLLKNGGAGGTLLLGLGNVANGASVTWNCGGYPIFFATDIDATLTGTAASAFVTFLKR